MKGQPAKPPTAHGRIEGHSPTIPVNGAARLLTAGELGARWQVPKSWVYAATREGRIPAVRLGRYYRFRLAAIEAFEAEGGFAAD